MANANFIKLAVSEVNKYVLNHLDKSDDTPDFDTFLVWSCKTLQNHKCLIRQHYTTGCITNARTMVTKAKCILTHIKSLKTKKLFAKVRNNYYDFSRNN